MPPEQIVKPTKASDLYGLAVTIICLLAHKSTTEIQNSITPENPYRLEFKSLLPPLNRPFLTWLNKMLQPQVNKRFSDAATALRALESIEIQPQTEIALWQKLSQSLFQLPNRTFILGTTTVGILSAIVIVTVDLAVSNFVLTTIDLAIALIGVMVATLAELAAATVVRSEAQARAGAIALAVSIPILLVIIVGFLLGGGGAISMTTAIVIAQLLSLIYSLLQQSDFGTNYPQAAIASLLLATITGMIFGSIIAYY